MKKLGFTVVMGCLLLAVAVPNAFGQAIYGNIVGTVTDPSGAAVPQAKVTIVDVGKGITFTATTNEAGNYSQQHLIVGQYEVRVEAVGFSTYVQKNVSVE